MPLQQVVTHHVTDLDQIFTEFYMANIMKIHQVIGQLGVGNMVFKFFENFIFEIPYARKSVYSAGRFFATFLFSGTNSMCIIIKTCILSLLSTRIPKIKARKSSDDCKVPILVHICDI